MKKVSCLIAILIVIAGCHKDKGGNGDVCNPTPFSIAPFVEKNYAFMCNSTNEYTYIFNKEAQIDSLSPTCFFTSPIVFPLDETDMVYIMVGRMSHYYNDTLQTSLQKDTCGKVLTYNVNMIQRTNTLSSNGGGILSMFCEVENIPSDYQVVVNYNYVPLGQ